MPRNDTSAARRRRQSAVSSTETIVTPSQPTERKWLKVGLELEGAWDCSREALTRRARPHSVHGDGSVHVDGYDDSDDDEECAYCRGLHEDEWYSEAQRDRIREDGCTCDGGASGWQGEISSIPMASRDEYVAMLTTLHPDEANASCGFHVHASFTPSDYSRLMEPVFWTFFTAKWRSWQRPEGANDDEWERFQYRLDGRQSYCRANFTPDAQVNDIGERYTQLNFCFRKHGTLECRLLPMFNTPAVSVAAVDYLLSIYDEFLSQPESAMPITAVAVAGIANHQTTELSGVVSVEETLEAELVAEILEPPPMTDADAVAHRRWSRNTAANALYRTVLDGFSARYRPVTIEDALYAELDAEGY